MTRHEVPSAVLRLIPLTTERVNLKVWLAAALLCSALLAIVIPLLNTKDPASTAEREVSYAGSGLLNCSQIVTLVTTTIEQHSVNKVLSKQLSDTLIRDNRSGKFSGVQSSSELATCSPNENGRSVMMIAIRYSTRQLLQI